MKMKQLAAAVVASFGIATAVPASAIIVGGIDFGVLGNTVHLETSTLAETFINGAGQNLTGYGLVSTVNGDSTYCADGSANCALYYYFTGYTVKTFDGTHVSFTGGTINLYYSGVAASNLLNQDSPTNVAFIQSLTPWVQFAGHTFYDPIFDAVPGFDGLQTLNGNGTLTGATLTETGAGQVDVVSGPFGLASVQSYMNGNSIGDSLGGFADVAVTSSSNNFALNPFDVTNGFANTCQTAPSVGQWCLQGTLNTRGATVVPEPATLALLGLGLAGLGYSRRRKQA